MSHETLAVAIDRPDGSSVRIGPIPYRHIAESMHHYFTVDSPRSRAGAEGCQVRIAMYEESISHLPLVPDSMDAVLNVINDPVEGADAPFPDLWDRLHAQHGYEAASKAWDGALNYISACEVAEENGWN